MTAVAVLDQRPADRSPRGSPGLAAAFGGHIGRSGSRRPKETGCVDGSQAGRGHPS